MTTKEMTKNLPPEMSGFPLAACVSFAHLEGEAAMVGYMSGELLRHSDMVVIESN